MMQGLASIARELYGLIVDDGSLALAAVMWTAIVWILRAADLLPTFWTGPLLFAGIVLVLVENVVRRSGWSR